MKQFTSVTCTFFILSWSVTVPSLSKAVGVPLTNFFTCDIWKNQINQNNFQTISVDIYCMYMYVFRVKCFIDQLPCLADYNRVGQNLSRPSTCYGCEGLNCHQLSLIYST